MKVRFFTVTYLSSRRGPGKSIKVRYMLYRVLYEIRYIEICLNTMKLILEKKFGKLRVRYIVGSLYQDLTIDVILSVLQVYLEPVLCIFNVQLMQLNLDI